MAKPQKKCKRLQYLRAEFADSGDGNRKNLQQYLKQAYEELPHVGLRRLAFAGKTWFGNWYENKTDFFLFQFSAATLGEEATTVPTNELSVEKLDLSSTMAPDGCEFADGDVISCVKNNDIFVCCTMLRPTSLQNYLLALFSAAELEDEALSLKIHKPANFEKLKLIKAGGIQNMRLDVSLDSPEFQRLEDMKDKGLLRHMIKSAFSKDKSLIEGAKISKANFKVEINIPKAEVRSASWAEDMAKEVLEDNIHYRLETGDGKVITSDDITISKLERLEPHGKTVWRNEAVLKLQEFMNDILRPRPKQ